VGFDFKERGENYSQQKYHWYHFSGTDFNADNNKTSIYKILGDDTKDWADSSEVDGEKGNYDYLMFADLDYDHPEVRKDVIDWGTWLSKEVTLKGIRFDAVKHFSEEFLRDFITNMDKTFGEPWFFVGEFWKDSLTDMHKYLDRMGKKFSLFDAPLVYNFSQLSKTEGGDLTKVFDDTLVKTVPVNAVVSFPSCFIGPRLTTSIDSSDECKYLGISCLQSLHILILGSTIHNLTKPLKPPSSPSSNP